MAANNIHLFVYFWLKYSKSRRREGSREERGRDIWSILLVFTPTLPLPPSPPPPPPCWEPSVSSAVFSVLNWLPLTRLSAKYARLAFNIHIWKLACCTHLKIQCFCVKFHLRVSANVWQSNICKNMSRSFKYCYAYGSCTVLLQTY